MTSDKKIEHIRNFISLVRDEEDYNSAYSHASYTRGLLSAWMMDMTISVEDWTVLTSELEEVMANKYVMLRKGDIPF